MLFSVYSLNAMHGDSGTKALVIAIIIIIVVGIVVHVVQKMKKEEEERRRREEEERKYREFEREVLHSLKFSGWGIVPYVDETVVVKSRQALENYDSIKFFKEYEGRLVCARQVLEKKSKVEKSLKEFLRDNPYKENLLYFRLTQQVNAVIKNASAYRIRVKYISSAGNNLGQKEIVLREYDINKFEQDPSLLLI